MAWAGPRARLAPLHGILLAFPIALFTSGVATDLAYLNTAQMQWTNFSAWLNAGGVAFGGLVLLWALVDAVRARFRGAAPLLYLGVVALMFIVGLVNAFQHSRDAWSSVGSLGLALSIVSAVLALVAGWLFHARAGVIREDL